MKCLPLVICLFMTLPLIACSQVAPPTLAAASQTTLDPIDNKPPVPGIHPQPIGDSSRTSLDWPGSYQGVLPCASCEGIKTQLTLNADGSYLLHTRYLGENEDKLIEEQGHFDWNERGGAIQLENGTWYQVGENQLFMLDQEGNRITGALAAHYRLAKSN